MANEKITVLTEDNFNTEVLEAEGTVLVDFWAGWCGPCRMLAPVIDQIAEEQPDFKVCKLDVDANGTIAAQCGVMSIPTIIIYKDGEEKKRIVGVQPKENIVAAAKA